jgi:hypothetical protein
MLKVNNFMFCFQCFGDHKLYLTQFTLKSIEISISFTCTSITTANNEIILITSKREKFDNVVNSSQLVLIAPIVT